MKKLVIIAVIVAMILGLMSVTSVSAEGPPSPPAPFATEDAVLVTVCEDVELTYVNPPASPDMIPKMMIDTKGYTKFKLYAYMKPVDDEDFASVNASYMRISIWEHATLDPEEFPYLRRGTESTTDWIKTDALGTIRPGYYSMVIPMAEDIYSVLGVSGMYRWMPNVGPPPPAPGTQPPITVSIYLLMSK